MEKSASFPAYSLGTTLSAQAQGCYLGIEPLLQRAASTGDAELLLTLLKVCQLSVTYFYSFGDFIRNYPKELESWEESPEAHLYKWELLLGA